jgi:hypothetical protein
MEGLVKPERIADPNHRDARGATEVRQDLTDKLMQFSLVHYFSLPSRLLINSSRRPSKKRRTTCGIFPFTQNVRGDKILSTK